MGVWQIYPLLHKGRAVLNPLRLFRNAKLLPWGMQGTDVSRHPKKIIMKLRVIWGRASALQLGRASAVSGMGNMHLPNYVDGELEHCEVCRPVYRAPHAPSAGTSTVFVRNGKLHVDLLFLVDLVVLRAMDVSSKY